MGIEHVVNERRQLPAEILGFIHQISVYTKHGGQLQPRGNHKHCKLMQES